MATPAESMVHGPKALLARLPSVDRVLQRPGPRALVERHGATLVADELRAQDTSHRIVGVDEAVAMVRAGMPLPLHPLIGGLPPEIAWRYLGVVADRVMPALQG